MIRVIDLRMEVGALREAFVEKLEEQVNIELSSLRRQYHDVSFITVTREFGSVLAIFNIGERRNG